MSRNPHPVLSTTAHQWHSPTTPFSLQEALNTIKKEKAIVDGRKAHFGAKIVRGAYMEKERKLSKLGGYPDPVNDSYESTGEMYNRVIDFLISETETSSDTELYVVVATHNESGAFHAVEQIRKRPKIGSNKFVFGQIYGMGEQLSMPLGKFNNFQVKN